MMTEKSVSQEKVSDVVHAAELSGVFLRSCGAVCETFPGFVQPSNTHLNITHDVKWELSAKRDLLVVTVQIDVRGTALQSSETVKKDDLLFEISVQQNVVYKLKKTDLSKDAIQVFATNNGLFNAYPFHREIIQGLSGKMGIVPILLPLLKPGP